MNTFNPDYTVSLFEIIDEILEVNKMSWDEFLQDSLDFEKAGKALNREPELLRNILANDKELK